MDCMWSNCLCQAMEGRAKPLINMNCGSNSCKPNNAGQNGKGDKNRTTSFKQYQNNYNKIKWQRPSGSESNMTSEHRQR